MYNGIIGHEQVQFMLDKERCEVKCEYPYRGITIVGKADYIPDSDVDPNGWEFKTGPVALEKSKRWHDWQAKFYCTMFARDKWSILQPVVKNERLMLREIGVVKRDDKWVLEQFEKVVEFHQEVLAEIQNLSEKDPEKLKELIDLGTELSPDELDMPLTAVP